MIRIYETKKDSLSDNAGITQRVTRKSAT